MRAALALGSNLPSRFGQPAANLHEALRRLTDLGEILAVSSFFETDPVGYTAQPRFTNAAALLKTNRGPLELLRGFFAIESSMGRVRAADLPPKGPRIIDLDLLLYEDENGRSLTLTDPDLVLPHPALYQRLFVLAPLAEIAPGMRHPVLERSIADLLSSLQTKGVSASSEPLTVKQPK